MHRKCKTSYIIIFTLIITVNNLNTKLTFNLQLIAIVDDEQIVKTEMLEDYFTDTIYPLCIKKYQTKLHGNGVCAEDGGPLITSLVMSGIRCNTLTRGKVC